MEHNNPEYYFVNGTEYANVVNGDLYSDPEEEPLSGDELVRIQNLIKSANIDFANDYYDVWDDDIIQYYFWEDL